MEMRYDEIGEKRGQMYYMSIYNIRIHVSFMKIISKRIF